MAGVSTTNASEKPMESSATLTKDSLKSIFEYFWEEQYQDVMGIYQISVSVGFYSVTSDHLKSQ